MGKKKPAGKFFRKIKKIKIRFFLPKNFRKIKIDIYQIPFLSASGDAPLPSAYLVKKSWLKSKIFKKQMF